MNKTAAGYVRVSSDEQAMHGISVEAQRERINAWAMLEQVPNVRIFEDAGYSGKNTQRPALQQLLAAVRAGEISAVVVWKLDRLSRSLRDTLAIIEDDLRPMGVSLHSLTEKIDTSSTSGRMMLNLLASFAQMEREQDSDRVVMAHKHLAQDCRYLGGHVALGYRVGEDRRLELDPVTAPIVRRVFDMYLHRSGYAEILDYLNGEAGEFFRRKTPWKKTDLNYLLNNEIYSGVYVRKIGADKRSRVTAPEVIRVPGGVPAILTDAEWEKVTALREANRTQSAAYAAKTVYPLSGLVRCAVCGALMPLNHGGKARDGTVERYYTCRKNCVRPARLEQLEDAVCAAIAALAGQADAVRAACEIASRYASARDEDHRAESLPIQAELQAVRRRLAQITDYIAEAGSSAPRTLMAELRRLEARETALVARLEDLRRPSVIYDAEAAVAALSAARDIQKKPPAERRALLQEALHAIQITDTDFRLVLAWHTCGGDDPPAYICHVLRERGKSACSLEVIYPS